MADATIEDPEAPDYVKGGTLLYIEVVGNQLTVYYCDNPGEGIVLFDGNVFTYTNDGEAVNYAFGVFQSKYAESGYDIEGLNDHVVTPPVDVPVWVGEY